jgi:2-aminoethylphosphonate aminotransferase
MKRNILLTPGPATTTDTVKQSLVIPDMWTRHPEFQQLMKSIRSDLVKIAGGDEKNYTSILFAGSGTAVMEATLCSVIPEGKKALIISNGAYGHRFSLIAEAHGIPYLELDHPWGSKLDFDRIQKALDSNDDIAAVFVTHHETTTGILNPVKDIGKIVKKHGCTYVVDTISSFAGIPFSMKDYDIDFLMSTANKCLQGIAGVSFVICKKSELEKTEGNFRSVYLDLYRQYNYFEETAQMQFTAPVQVMHALRQAIDEYFKEGAKNRYHRYKKSYDVLVKGLHERGFAFFLKDDVEKSNILVTVYDPKHPNFDFKTFHDRLHERGFTIYPSQIPKTFRIVVIGAITYKDIQKFLKTVDDVLGKMGVNL